MLWRGDTRPCLEAIETSVKLTVYPQAGAVDSGVNAQRAELGSPPALELVRRDGFELIERLLQALAEEPRGLVVIRVGAALRLGDDPVDDAQLEAVKRVRLEGGGRLLRLAGVAPENGRAALRER